MEQSLFNISIAYALHLPCEVVSWILRADLTAHSPAFADVVAEFPPPFLANGLDVDVSGEHLFVANSLGGRSSGIYRVSIKRGAEANPEEPWYAPACEPNGIKVRNHTVYYTGNNTVPVLRAVLGRVDINASGEPTGGQSLYQRLFSTFDDFDVAADGFVVASFADFAKPWTWIQPRTFSAGGLRFVSSEGQDLGSVPGVRRPSAVLIVGDSNVFDKGEVLIADKDTHGVLQLTPDDAWRRWLCGVTAPAPRHHPKAA
jgi:hypothetical protein